MTLHLTRSRPRNVFKGLLGNANHLIITALVGLDAVERGVVSEVPRDLRAAWSPRDAVISAKRSRRLILDMALIRAIDAVDIYLCEAIRKPTLVQSVDFRRDLDSAGQSIFRKLEAVERNYANLNSLPLAIIFLMVAWRNRSAHTEASRDAPQHHLDILRSRSGELSERFRGLDAKMLLEGYDSIRPISFKEVASLINAAHHLISELDSRLLTSLDVERYLKEAVWESLGNSQKQTENIEKARMRRAVSIWGKDPTDRPSAVLRVLNQLGFSEIAPNKNSGAVIPSELLKKLQEKTPKSILKWADTPY